MDCERPILLLIKAILLLIKTDKNGADNKMLLVF